MSRFHFVHDHRDTYEVKRLCQVLDVNRSSSYKWLSGAGARAARRREDQHLAERIRRIHADSGVAYGSPRVTAELRETGTRFADGQWTLEATEDALLLRIDADNEDALQRLQTGVAARVEKIGRRDGLQVHWWRLETDAVPSPELTGANARTPDARRPRGTTTGLMAGGALIVAVHLGIGGAASAGASWAGWAADAGLLLILVKLLFMGRHVLLGRTALRRGIALRHRRRHRERSGADSVS